MPAYRILKEQPVSKAKWTEDLSSHSEFVQTGESVTCEPDETQAAIDKLQADNGGCYALQLADA